ncbi:TetR/AcrR family transcriptional regulator [Streptoalloteichus hindustanus]|uniref:Transcriptional regulator, TetR family n=1 Tax=Streptoalloteichus hindustanus TaxID=2017 RepID=A0A1M5JVG2_STRHI|nr:TetR/AcrR family transcriptional regulator [Streptoalloteichus hindustanus]SHG44290.1 transcriptional regulator, TetR family [Streptoalloteichus hindustanus]
MAGRRQNRSWNTVWAETPRTPSGHQAGISREQIVLVAVELLDQDGMEALSMRRLASRVGVAAMSLYWHVANKGHLLELAMDEVFGEVSIPAVDLHWAERVRALATSYRAVSCRHPWVARLLGVYPPIGPNLMRFTEAMLVAFGDSGLSGADLDRAVNTLADYLLGFITAELRTEQRLRAAGMDIVGFAEMMRPLVKSLAGDRFPEVSARVDRMSERTMDERFAFGLDSVLVGLSARGPRP